MATVWTDILTGDSASVLDYDEHDVRRYGGLVNALAYFGLNTAALKMLANEVITGAVTVPSNISLNIEQGGGVTKAGSATLTIQGNFTAGLYQVFFGFNTGDVTFAKGTILSAWPSWFGATVSASAVINTAAFNAAMAAYDDVLVAVGSYELNALAAWTSSASRNSLRLHGMGAHSELVFSTSTIGVNFVSSNFDGYFRGGLEDLAIRVKTGSPTAVVQNDGFSNFKIRNVRVRNIAGDTGTPVWVIVNNNHYGLDIEDSLVASITGNGLWIRNTGDGTKYSAVSRIKGCDFTSITGKAIEFERGFGLTIQDTTIQDTGTGLTVNTASGTTNVAANIHLKNVWFEGNTLDMDFKSNLANSNFTQATLESIFMAASGTINVYDNSHLTIIGTHVTSTTITGTGGTSSVRTVDTNGFTMVNVAFVSEYLKSDTTNRVAFIPSWTSSGTAPSLGNGTLTGYYTKQGKRVKIAVDLIIGSTTTFGTGNWSFGNFPYANNNSFRALGSAFMYDASAALSYLGMSHLEVSASAINVAYDAAALWVGPTVPFTWANGDLLRLEFEYEVV